MVRPKQKRRRAPVQSTTAVPIHVSFAIRFSHQVEKLKGQALLKRFKGYSKAAVYKHAKKPLDGSDSVEDKRLGSGIGRPSKLTKLDRRNIDKAVKQLREEIGGMFNSKRVACEAGLDQKVHNRTVRRAMKAMKYEWLNARRKGQLSIEDEKARLRWARSKQHLSQNFWSRGVSIYLDAVGFIYKKNAFDQACATGGKLWRRRCEGLARGCTAKLNKAGVKQVKFMVGISYNRGVVLCEPYSDSMTGKDFSKMCDACLPAAFQRSINRYDMRYLQDGCPVQNSQIAQEILDLMGAELVSIPPRSPDLNPIENFFHMVGKALKADSIEKRVTSQTEEEFEERVKGIILNMDKESINKCIGSMKRRIEEVIRRKGGRIAY